MRVNLRCAHQLRPPVAGCTADRGLTLDHYMGPKRPDAACWPRVSQVGLMARGLIRHYLLSFMRGSAVWRVSTSASIVSCVFFGSLPYSPLAMSWFTRRMASTNCTENVHCCFVRVLLPLAQSFAVLSKSGSIVPRFCSPCAVATISTKSNANTPTDSKRMIFTDPSLVARAVQATLVRLPPSACGFATSCCSCAGHQRRAYRPSAF